MSQKSFVLIRSLIGAAFCASVTALANPTSNGPSFSTATTKIPNFPAVPGKPKSTPLPQIGGSDVGGGQGVVCYNSDGSIESVELLDLWEARTLYGRSILKTSQSLNAQILAGASKLQNSLFTEKLEVTSKRGNFRGQEALREWLGSEAVLVAEQHKALRNAGLKLTDDAHEEIFPQGNCKTEQLVRYSENPARVQVLVNQDLVDRMDVTNQAALWLHESFYKYLRAHGESTSLRVRRTIGMIFSGYTFPNWNALLPATYYRCSFNDGAQDVLLFEVLSQSSQNGRTVRTLGARIHRQGLLAIGYEGTGNTGVVIPDLESAFIKATSWSQAPEMLFALPLGEFSISSDHVIAFQPIHNEATEASAWGSATPARKTLSYTVVSMPEGVKTDSAVFQATWGSFTDGDCKKIQR